MANVVDPFESSKTLADWSAKILVDKGIDSVSTWRMLEYWFQVELYRAIVDGQAGDWLYVGEYEQPYYTDIPTSNAKRNYKWIDLVCAEPNLEEPQRMVWVELKDIGRNKDTFIKNASGLGEDLAALYTFDPLKTKMAWLDPPEHVMDRGRLPEWNKLSNAISFPSHLISQIVLAPLRLLDDAQLKQVENNWLTTFKKRIKHLATEPVINIADSQTKNFMILALITQPWHQNMDINRTSAP
ncbi:MAG: hypothetical protein FJZ94_03995 [Chloroflexi bacterium]|nr:hypothetical protein [Chloroflexota bacterium]